MQAIGANAGGVSWPIRELHRGCHNVTWDGRLHRDGGRETLVVKHLGTEGCIVTEVVKHFRRS